ncbi:hypothetical protein [Halalkalicoccus salilacus]|uniref:hypothetical protein n=1 Tax=Halalkalicoccus salilacus TaxID=3117459 RepID=UPI00300F0E1A
MAGADAEERSYKGLLGSFRYSFGASESYLYKGYVLVSAALGIALTLLFTFALIGVIAATLGASETITLVRSFFVLVALLVIAPIIAPVLLVARRHRKRLGAGTTYDAALAIGGYLFIGALYLGLAISVPPEHRESTTGALGAVVETLYGLPEALGLLPPVLAIVAIVLLHHRFR